MPIAFQIIAGLFILFAMWLAYGVDTYNAMEIAGYVDYIRPGAPSDYGPRR